LRANELMDNLRYMIAAHGLQLLNGHKVVEVKNSEINKGRAAYSLINNVEIEHDFILAIGDDYTDEDMFKALPQNAYTIKVGNHISVARYYLEDVNEVRELLKTLVNS